MNRFAHIAAWPALLTLTLMCAQCVNPIAQPQGPAALDGRNARVNVAPTPNPQPRGRAEGEVLPFEYRGGDLRAAALAHPVPEVWLQFEGPIEHGTGARKVVLPAEARELLKAQWERALAAKYDWELGENLDASTRQRLSIVIWNAADDAQSGLTKVEIEAPNGKRNISAGEAGDLVHFISEAVFDIVRQVKTHRPDKG